jgi:hypothetical protein
MGSKDSGEPIQRDPITRSSGDNVPPPDPDAAGPDDPDATMSATDMDPSSPHGVGESIGRRGEQMADSEGKEAGREEKGAKGKAQRPTGTSDSRDATSVDPDN